MIKNQSEKNKVINETACYWSPCLAYTSILSSTLLQSVFSETKLLPALPEIIDEYNISYGTAAWIFSAYLIVVAVMTPIVG